MYNSVPHIISQPYGVSDHTLDELKSQKLQFCLQSQYSTNLSDFENLYTLCDPKLKQTDLVNQIISHRTRHTYVYRVYTRRTQPPTSSSSHPTNPQSLPQSLPSANTTTQPTTDINPHTEQHDIQPEIQLNVQPQVEPMINVPPIPSPHSAPIPVSSTTIAIPSLTIHDIPYPVHHIEQRTTRDDISSLSKLVHRPRNFKGAGQFFQRHHTKDWINKMKTWLQSIKAAPEDHVTIALTYLEPPAFNIITSQKSISNEAING